MFQDMYSSEKRSRTEKSENGGYLTPIRVGDRTRKGSESAYFSAQCEVTGFEVRQQKGKEKGWKEIMGFCLNRKKKKRKHKV